MASPTPGVCDMALPMGFKTSSSPSIIVFTTTIGFYYLNALWNGGPDAAKKSFIPGLMFLIFVLAQVGVIYYQSVYFNKCPPFVLVGIVFAVFFGAAFGTITYWVSTAMNKNSLALAQGFTNYKEKFTDQSAFNAIASPGGTASDIAAAAKAKAAGQPTTGTVGQCLQKSADSDEYVCDVYKDGKLVTKTVTE